MKSWILSLLLFLAPHSDFAWTFDATAAAIDKIVHETPIYDTNDGPERTAAELVAVAYYESSFDPMAFHANDGAQGVNSVGLAQISTSNLPALGLSDWRDLTDPETNLRAAAKMLRASHRTCRGFPWAQQLASYATGRGLCSVPEGVVASVERLTLARRLLAERPAFWTQPSNWTVATQ
jgi:Transglycosylase SLT domain